MKLYVSNKDMIWRDDAAHWHSICAGNIFIFLCEKLCNVYNLKQIYVIAPSGNVLHRFEYDIKDCGLEICGSTSSESAHEGV